MNQGKPVPGIIPVSNLLPDGTQYVKVIRTGEVMGLLGQHYDEHDRPVVTVARTTRLQRWRMRARNLHYDITRERTLDSGPQPRAG